MQVPIYLYVLSVALGRGVVSKAMSRGFVEHTRMILKGNSTVDAMVDAMVA